MINVTTTKQISLSVDDLIHEFGCLTPGCKVCFFEKLIDFVYNNHKEIALLCNSNWYGTTADDWIEHKNKLIELLNNDYSEYVKDNRNKPWISTLGMVSDNLDK